MVTSVMQMVEDSALWDLNILCDRIPDRQYNILDRLIGNDWDRSALDRMSEAVLKGSPGGEKGSLRPP